MAVILLFLDLVIVLWSSSSITEHSFKNIIRLQVSPMTVSPSLFWKWWHTQLIDKQWYTLFPINCLIQNHAFLAPSAPLIISVHVVKRICLFLCFYPLGYCRGGFLGTSPHCPDVGGRAETVTGFDSPLGRWPTFPLRAVSLREGGRRVVGKGG